MDNNAPRKVLLVLFLILALVCGLLIGTILLIDGHCKTEAELLTSEIRNLSLRNIKLERENNNLKKQVVEPSRIWLPEQLTFAGQKVPIENWYVRSRLVETISNRLRPQYRPTLVSVVNKDYWVSYIDSVATHYGLHNDIKYLCVQESTLSITARSPVGAMGICQFMRNTGLSYGLKINWRVDERLLPEKAIDASMRLLVDAYDEFNGDIFLAMAAYNAGSTRIMRAIEAHGGNNPSFFDLGNLPLETRSYPYGIIAFKLILENLDRYNIYYIPEPLINYPEITLADTTLSRITDINEIAYHYGMGHPEFKKLNPHVLSSLLNKGDWTFRIPINNTN